MKRILHITVGEPGWEPTSSDLESIAELFLGALADPEGGLVTTRTGVVVKLLSVEDDTEVQVISANIDKAV